jgi:large subunit ribosomal protein L6
MPYLTKRSIKIPQNINIQLKNNLLFFEGPLGTKTLKLVIKVILNQNKNELILTNTLFPELLARKNFKSKVLLGSTYSIIKQIILGLSVGFYEELNIVGVGYKAVIKNEKNVLALRLGFSHQIFIKIPVFLKVYCIKSTKIAIFGNNKQEVSQMAAIIRAYKTPEPYKGKGILYQNEKVNQKEGKKS